MKAEANTVDEQHVLDILEAASDYEKEVGRLDANSKGIVKKLREWAGDTSKVAGQKRQCKDGSLAVRDAETKTFLGSQFEKETKVPTKKPVQPTPVPVFMKKENATPLAQRIEIWIGTDLESITQMVFEHIKYISLNFFRIFCEFFAIF